MLTDELVYATEEAQRHQLINNPTGQIGGMLNRLCSAWEMMPSVVSLTESTFERLEAIRSTLRS